MNPNKSDITIVLDRSGSMASIADDTIGGFNRFLEDQKKIFGGYITIHQFDDHFETLVCGMPIQLAAPLNRDTFVPRGSTALLDAMGRAINIAGKRLSDQPEAERAGKVIFVVITDGQENASKEFSRDKVFKMVTHQQDVYKWEFVFLAANQDAIQSGAFYGFKSDKSMSFAANAAGVGSSYDSFSTKMSAFRSNLTMSVAFDDEDRKKQKEAGA